MCADLPGSVPVNSSTFSVTLSGVVLDLRRAWDVPGQVGVCLFLNISEATAEQIDWCHAPLSTTSTAGTRSQHWPSTRSRSATFESTRFSTAQSPARILHFLVSSTVGLLQMSPIELEATRVSCRERFLAANPELTVQDIEYVRLFEEGELGHRRVTGNLMFEVALKDSVTTAEIGAAESNVVVGVTLTAGGGTLTVDLVFVAQSPTTSPTTEALSGIDNSAGSSDSGSSDYSALIGGIVVAIVLVIAIAA